MKNLWKVTFDVKYTHCKDRMDETVKIVANGDGEAAIRKARKFVLRKTFTDQRDTGSVQCEAVDARLVSLEQLHTIDG